MPPPRRAPWPCDIFINGIGYMVGRPDPRQGGGAPLVATKPQDLSQTQPIEYGYSSQSPVVEKVHPYLDLSLGMGQAIQFEQAERRYHYALGMDLSIAGFGILGPQITKSTPGITAPDATNGITGFVELNGTLFALNGRYIWQTTDGNNWTGIGAGSNATTSFDFGVATPILDAIAMQTNAGGIVGALYVAVGDTVNFYRWRPGTDAAANPANASGQHARCFGKSSTFLYLGQDGNNARSCDVDSDPYTFANWGAALSVGTHESPINRIIGTSLQDTATTTLGSVLFLKTDGIYAISGTVDSTGTGGGAGSFLDHPLYPFLGAALDSKNGVGATQYINDVIVPYRDGLYRIKPDFSLDQIGLERLTNNKSAIKGRAVATAGHETFGLYAAVSNPDTADTYLMKWGAWLTPKEPPAWIRPTGTQAVTVDAWHGSLTVPFGATSGAVGNTSPITAMAKSSVGAPSGHSRLYLGFADGSVRSFILPCTANPLGCSQYLYTTAGQTYLPSWHAMFINDRKILKRFTVSAMYLNSTNYADVLFKSADQSVWQGLSQHFQAAPTTDIDLPVGGVGQLIDFQLSLVGPGGATTPQITGLGVHYATRPPPVQVVEVSVLADSYLLKRNGARLRLSEDQIVANIEALLDPTLTGASPVPVIFPDEKTLNMALIGYKKSEMWDERARRFNAALTIQMAPFQNSSVVLQPLAGVATYADLLLYTVAMPTYQGVWNALGGLGQVTDTTQAGSAVYARLTSI